MKKIKSNKWFFIVLLIVVIAYLSIKPESFHEGLDISRNITRNDISNNITYTYTYDDSEKEKKKEKEKTDSTYIPYIETEIKIKNWFDFDTYSTADFAFITIVFILFFIVLVLLSKL